jgi:3-hydroxyisobutyrate dehydrogenase
MANPAPKPLSASTTRLGWIGTGVMGLSMCGHLMGKGYSATVYNRTKTKAQTLLDKGATWVDSPRAVAAQSNVIFTMVGYPRDVREVYFADSGVLAGVKPGSVVIDM